TRSDRDWSSDVCSSDLILWTAILAGYIAIVTFKFRARLADPLVGWALLTMLVVSTFFFGLMLGPANPFRTVSPPLGYDGPGPNRSEERRVGKEGRGGGA